MNQPVTNSQMEAFLAVLDPANNTTGGGSASAVAGAMAAGLVAMVARLSVGPKSSEPEAFYQEIAQAGAALVQTLMAGAEEDARAFNAVMDAYRMPKATEAEKAARREAVQAAMMFAARVPLQNAEGCGRAAGLAAQLEGRSNPQAASDLQCAAYLAQAGLQGCLANVAINLPSIKDPAAAEEIGAKAEALRKVYSRSQA
jgi:methenyltetrahydrofolate cyclohydrolase